MLFLLDHKVTCLTSFLWRNASNSPLVKQPPRSSGSPILAISSITVVDVAFWVQTASIHFTIRIKYILSRIGPACTQDHSLVGQLHGWSGAGREANWHAWYLRTNSSMSLVKFGYQTKIGWPHMQFCQRPIKGLPLCFPKEHTPHARKVQIAVINNWCQCRLWLILATLVVDTELHWRQLWISAGPVMDDLCLPWSLAGDQPVEPVPLVSPHLLEGCPAQVNDSEQWAVVRWAYMNIARQRD